MTPTFTPGPCEFAVAAGDSLYALALRCGHQSYDVIDDIIALNELPNEAALQIGQVIRVPLPTATLDINAANTLSAGVAANAAANDLDGDGQVSAEELIASRQQAAEPTLDPNLQWYVVQAGETLYEVIAKNNINVKLLSEINPEVDFPQCDFGETFGGPRCAVFLSEGQRLRVPAPTPTPTIPPTASGSETPTPTATATINIPTALQPDNGAVFDAASIVTLRWSTTGTLGRDEVYLIRARNLSTGEIFTGITCDLSFDLPREWQAKTEQYIEFEWQMSITNVSPFGTGQDNYMTRFSGYALCDMSFEPPISWLPAAANTVDYGRIVDLRLGDERFPTPLRRFQWQGRP
jgi:LysM repeat protein